MLCGKENRNNILDNREITDRILQNKRDDVYSIYSERVFSIIEDHETESNIDLLKFEELLVEISDGVILFLESYGTATELGAFAYLDSLAKKMLVFVQSQYEEDKSFINTGPIKRIQNLTNPNDNLGGVIFTKYLENGNIDFGHDNYIRILRFLNSKTVSLDNENLTFIDQDKKIMVRPALLIYFIIDIVFVFDYIEKNDIYSAISYVLTGKKYSIDFIIASRNEFNSILIWDYIVDMLIKWKILQVAKSKKNDIKLLTVNHDSLINKTSIYPTFGKVLFTGTMYGNSEFMKYKVDNRKHIINTYGDVYEG